MKRLLLVGAAAAAPAAFPLSQLGIATFHVLGVYLVIPAALLVVASAVGRGEVSKLTARGALAGALATLALEAVRYPGFKLGYLPGNLPELMGVLLLDRFALGPSAASKAAGFAYHFWNGASLGVVFALLRGNRSRWWAVPYGVAVGVGFLASPVVQALGVGLFGVDFGWHFAATVLAAHVAFGTALGWALALLPGGGRSECSEVCDPGDHLRLAPE